MAPVVSRIRIYPIKSLDPVELESAQVGINALTHDREFAMVAEDGQFVNGKRTGRVNHLQTNYDLLNYRVTFSERNSNSENIFHLIEDKKKIESYLSGFFNEKINFLQNQEGRFMDIPVESGITILSTGSLEYLSQNIEGHSVENMRLRFRATLEISGVAPFWEEKLANHSGQAVYFQAGEVKLAGISLRARCNVPPRNPFTGETDKTFIKQMLKARDKSVPEWSKVKELQSLYHLTVNCFIPFTETGKFINKGDEVVIL